MYEITQPEIDVFNNQVKFKVFDRDFIIYVNRICTPISKLNLPRIAFNVCAVTILTGDKIEGDIIEIGVWAGGGVLSMIKTLEKYNDTNRQVHLYDTFEGMTQPDDIDTDYQGNSAKNLMDSNPDFWKCACDIDTVKSNIEKNTDYPKGNIKYHKGDILKNKFIPDKIALLRLDTDWYESTKHELETFFPKVVKGGIVIVDDYGHFNGAKKAVNEFLLQHPELKIYQIDYTGIFFIK